MIRWPVIKELKDCRNKLNWNGCFSNCLLTFVFLTLMVRFRFFCRWYAILATFTGPLFSELL